MIGVPFLGAESFPKPGNSDEVSLLGVYFDQTPEFFSQDIKGKFKLGMDGLELNSSASAAVDLTITNSSFLRNRTNGLQVLADGNSAVSVRATGSRFDRETGPGIGVDLSAVGAALLDFDVSDSTVINGLNGSAFNSYVAGTSTTRGRFDNNPDVQLGGGSSPGMGVRLSLNESAMATYDVSNNVISNIGSDAGIQTVARAGTGRMDTRVNSNSVAVDGTGLSLFNIWVQAQDNNILCANVISNTNTGLPFLGTFRERTSSAGATVLLQGFVSNATATWSNNGNTPENVNSTNVGTLGDGTCADVPTSGFPFQ